MTSFRPKWPPFKSDVSKTHAGERPQRACSETILIDSALVETTACWALPNFSRKLSIGKTNGTFLCVVEQEISQGVGVQQRPPGSHHNEDAGPPRRPRHHSSRLLWVKHYIKHYFIKKSPTNYDFHNHVCTSTIFTVHRTVRWVCYLELPNDAQLVCPFQRAIFFQL